MEKRTVNKIDNAFGVKRFNFKSCKFNINGITLNECMQYLKELKGTITESFISNGQVVQSFYMSRG